MINYFIFF